MTDPTPLASRPCAAEGCDRPRIVFRSGRVGSRCAGDHRSPESIAAAADKRREVKDALREARRAAAVVASPDPSNDALAGPHDAPDGPEQWARTEDYNWAQRLRDDIAEKWARGLHVIADIHFAREWEPATTAFTECVCGWRCGGATDDAMSRAWNVHANRRGRRPTLAVAS